MNKSNDFLIENGSLVEYLGSGGTVSVPNGVRIIKNDAFRWSSFLRYIKLPDTIIEIGDFAFADCREMVDINLPGNLTSIGVRAFAWCDRLRSLDIPNSVSSIGAEAFYGCNNLTIRCGKESYAEKYAKEAGIPYTCD